MLWLNELYSPETTEANNENYLYSVANSNLGSKLDFDSMIHSALPTLGEINFRVHGHYRAAANSHC